MPRRIELARDVVELGAHGGDSSPSAWAAERDAARVRQSVRRVPRPPRRSAGDPAGRRGHRDRERVDRPESSVRTAPSSSRSCSSPAETDSAARGCSSPVVLTRATSSVSDPVRSVTSSRRAVNACARVAGREDPTELARALRRARRRVSSRPGTYAPSPRGRRPWARSVATPTDLFGPGDRARRRRPARDARRLAQPRRPRCSSASTPDENAASAWCARRGGHSAVRPLLQSGALGTPTTPSPSPRTTLPAVDVSDVVSESIGQVREARLPSSPVWPLKLSVPVALTAGSLIGELLERLSQLPTTGVGSIPRRSSASSVPTRSLCVSKARRRAFTSPSLPERPAAVVETVVDTESIRWARSISNFAASSSTRPSRPRGIFCLESFVRSARALLILASSAGSASPGPRSAAIVPRGGP